MKDRTERDYDEAIDLLKNGKNHSEIVLDGIVDRIERRVAQLVQQAEVEAYRNRGAKPWSRSRD